jgi:hypothetical protein
MSPLGDAAPFSSEKAARFRRLGTDTDRQAGLERLHNKAVVDIAMTPREFLSSRGLARVNNRRRTGQ